MPRHIQVFSLIFLASLVLPVPPGAHAAETFSGMSYLDNGTIKLGIDLDIGGAITYLSASGSDENVVNSHDWGRQIQMSFYSGPNPFVPNGKEPQPVWRGLGWNPIQSGDCFNNRSRVTAHTNDGKSLYVQCIPMQWPLNNEPGECTFETWITLEGKTAKVRSRINNARSDKTQYSARGQELPAVYTNGTYYRLFTYTGDAPFTGGPLHQVTKVWSSGNPAEVPGGPWDNWYATENWAALVRVDNFGVGVWSPGTYNFTGGFAGKPGKGGPKDGPTGYVGPSRVEILDHNIQYEYSYVLILGTLDEIRQHVYAQAAKKHLPAYTFERDRQSWTLQDCADEGWPIEGSWRVHATGAHPVLVGPSDLWKAEEAPRLHIRGTFPAAGKCTVRWECFGKEDTEKSGSASFEVMADAAARTYEVDLSASEAYRGFCTRLLIYLDPEADRHGIVDIQKIELTP